MTGFLIGASGPVIVRRPGRRLALRVRLARTAPRNATSGGVRRAARRCPRDLNRHLSWRASAVDTLRGDCRGGGLLLLDFSRPVRFAGACTRTKPVLPTLAHAAVQRPRTGLLPTVPLGSMYRTRQRRPARGDCFRRPGRLRTAQQIPAHRPRPD